MCGCGNMMFTFRRTLATIEADDLDDALAQLRCTFPDLDISMLIKHNRITVETGGKSR